MARYFWALALLLVSCDLSSLVAPPPVPSSVPGAVETIVAQTAAAAETQTALNVTVIPSWTPSWTPVPSKTPSLTPSPTATFVFRLGSLTPVKTATSSGGGSSLDGCKLVSQSPEDGTHMEPKQVFQVAWKVRNTGDRSWDSNAVDFVYSSGSKFAADELVIDLPNTVAVGDTIKLTLTLTAPKNNGSYTSEWALRRGQSEFCHVNIKIVVP